MTLTLELPEDMAAQLTALWPEEKERNCFCINAIGDALLSWENENKAEFRLWIRR